MLVEINAKINDKVMELKNQLTQADKTLKGRVSP